MNAGAVIDGEYRYLLTRRWADGPMMGWLMLNPSTADAEKDDATIRRCIGFAKAWGFGALSVLNLFALRATDPAALLRHPDPVGPRNDEYITDTIGVLLEAAWPNATVVAAWGSHRMAAERGRQVVRGSAWAVQLKCLGKTKSGAPRHPLYVPANATLRNF